jgi:hypothetical protein
VTSAVRLQFQWPVSLSAPVLAIPRPQQSIWPDLVEVFHRVAGTVSSFSRCHPGSMRGFLVVRSVFPCQIVKVGLVLKPSDQRLKFSGLRSTLMVGS